jgi:hypothetical protein
LSDFKSYFKNYEDELRHWGVTDIFNPAAIDWLEDVKWETRMRYYLKIFMDGDVLVLLPNWKKSLGARLEVYVARAVGIRIVRINDLIKELF